MRCLADHDVWAVTLRALRSWGHDVVTASEAGLARASDADLLRRADNDSRALITRDSDFGRLVVTDGFEAGVVFLRITPETKTAVHDRLRRVLHAYDASDLRRSLIVVEPGRHRIRRR